MQRSTKLTYIITDVKIIILCHYFIPSKSYRNRHDTIGSISLLSDSEEDFVDGNTSFLADVEEMTSGIQLFCS